MIPYEVDLEKVMGDNAGSIPGIDTFAKEDEDADDVMDQFRPFLMGKCAAVVNEQKSARAVVDEFVDDAVTWIGRGQKMISKL